METILKNKIFKFINLQNAESFAYRCHKPMRVILGDDNRFWVVTPAQAEKLYRLGFEYAN